MGLDLFPFGAGLLLVFHRLETFLAHLVTPHLTHREEDPIRAILKNLNTPDSPGGNW